jgi:hypothetical protein
VVQGVTMQRSDNEIASSRRDFNNDNNNNDDPNFDRKFDQITQRRSYLPKRAPKD